MEEKLKNKLKINKIIIISLLVILLILLVFVVFQCLKIKDQRTNNASNMGMVTSGDEYIFYYKYGSGIIKIKEDKEYQITDDQAYSLNYKDNYIYYTTPNSTGGINIKKVSHNGDTNVLLASIVTESTKMYLENDKLYYMTSNPSTISRMDLDGKNQEVVITRTISDFEIQNGIIYFTDESGYLCKINTDGTGYEQISEEILAKKFQIVDNNVYYCNDENTSLFRFNIKNNKKETISDKMNTSIYNITNNAIYYLDKEKCSICKMNFKGEDSKEIAKIETDNTKINIIGTDIYYLDMKDNSYKTFRIKTTGKALTEIKY